MPSRTKAKNSKGRRYTLEEKSDILAYVAAVNSERGRGGQTAAAKKYSISQLTISSWMRKSPSAVGPVSGRPSSINNTLAKLATLHSQIVTTESGLVKLKQEFDRIKRSI